MSYLDYVFVRFRDAIRGLEGETARDSYAISICQDWTNDPRHPWLCLGGNTVHHGHEQIPRGENPTPSDPQEAKWNVMAFWPGPRGGWLAVVGGSSPDFDVPDFEGIAHRERWADSLGLTVSDAELATWDGGPGVIAQRIDALDRAYADLCVATARRLHESGLVAEKFGRAIPILILGNEGRQADSAAWTRAANPLGLAKEYQDWVLSCS